MAAAGSRHGDAPARDAAAERRQAEALAFGDRRLRDAEYAGCVGAFASELQSLGAAGERVATVLPNTLEACVAQFAVQAAGAQLAPLNPLYTDRELGEILPTAPAGAIVDDARRPGRTARGAGAQRCRGRQLSRRLDAARGGCRIRRSPVRSPSCSTPAARRAGPRASTSRTARS
jgi:non-ribosomal peptide synthetase component E (peptide arylation enzyme)